MTSRTATDVAILALAFAAGSMIAAASGGAMKIDIRGTAMPAAPPPKPLFDTPVSRIAKIATA